MSLDLEEANETQQLMQNEGEEEEPKVPQPATSPVTSNKLSSEAASLTSKNPHTFTSTGNNSINDSAKVSYVNERRLHRDFIRSNNTRPKHMPKETPDVKHMEKALLELLSDFHTGKLSAFGTGCSMEQMINIRDQQEHLARLHFRLYGDAEKPTEDSFENSASKDNMAQLVQSLEQLSASIELLQSDGVPNSSSNKE
ncbi:coiled-coil domain-containing protein 28A [Maniola hyperantus]|uniref:coiled-coil domain-containing protein 28A n=1 Tax=Aphantopus hyperantus TaxID=2795564 RepID=UPI0015683C88|nr:coiled-coil domain-containing protein 28A [Maniola hyperantus]